MTGKNTAVLLAAAGSGSRMGGGVPKQYRLLGDAPVLVKAARAFCAMDAFSVVAAAVPAEDMAYCRDLFDRYGLPGVTLTAGGATRQESVYNALKSLPQDVDAVLVHDAARPFVDEWVIRGVLDALKLRKEQVIVSICAGISAEFIRSHTIPDARIILCMPNTPLMLGLGATALAKCDGVTDAEFSLAMQMFATCGIAEEIPESKMREIIAVNSSSPAFLYLYAKGFLEFAKAEGLDDGAALRLFAQAMIGSAKMMTDSGYSIDELIKMVSSPGGTTLAGLDQLYAGDLTDTVRKCCDACTTRAYELAGAERKKAE